jgi:hypothetical protein
MTTEIIDNELIDNLLKDYKPLPLFNLTIPS